MDGTHFCDHPATKGAGRPMSGRVYARYLLGALLGGVLLTTAIPWEQPDREREGQQTAALEAAHQRELASLQTRVDEAGQALSQAQQTIDRLARDRDAAQRETVRLARALELAQAQVRDLPLVVQRLLAQCGTHVVP